MGDPDSQIKAFEATDFKTVDEIVAALRPMMDRYAVVATMVSPPLKIYRARRSVELPTWDKVSDLSYPKGGSHSDQRANRKGIEIFYAASNYDLAVTEIRPGWGDFVVLSEWEITAPFLMQVVGMDEIPEYQVPKNRNIKLTEFLRRNFYGPKGRLWSIAVAEFYLSEIDYSRVDNEQQLPVRPDAFHGLKYPSAVRQNWGHNFAIRGSFVDSSMQITRADLLYIDPAKTGGNAIRHADKFDHGRIIMWKDTA